MRPSLTEVLGIVQARLSIPSALACRIVGIDGPAGSGKSTLAQAISPHLGAPVIPIDDFLSWGDLDSWWPRFDAQVVEPLLAGHHLRYRRRDWVGDEFGNGLGEWAEVPWHPVAVIEGMTATRRAIADRLACAIWVEAPEEVRLRRGVERDGESHRQLWIDSMRTEDEWFRRDGMRERADLIVTTD